MAIATPPPSMEEQVNRLVAKVWETSLSLPPTSRYLIAISGVPGSGKTTLAQTIVSRLNALASSHASKPPCASNSGTSTPSRQPPAIHVPMDGYHYTRAQLSAMADPETAHARRGAAFTFDADAYYKLVRLVREPLTIVPAVEIEPPPSSEPSSDPSSAFAGAPQNPDTDSQPKPAPTPTIFAPSFSHATKDPIENDISIPSSARLVFFEGNYVNFAVPGPWDEARKLMDEVWWVDVGEEVVAERLAVRHAEAGIVGSMEEGRQRARGSDRENAVEIERERGVVKEWVVGEGGREERA